MGIFKLAAGVAVGYVLGSRAGREQYENIAATARKVSAHPTVVQAQEKVKSYIGTTSSTGSSSVTNDVDAPAITHKATTPAVTPKATTPATTPAVTPKVTTPAVTPKVTTPAVTPKVTTPAVTPKVETPLSSAPKPSVAAGRRPTPGGNTENTL